MFRQFGTGEILLILLVILLLFGAKKLPDTARGLGRSMRIFKSEMKGMQEDDAAAEAKTAKSEPPQITVSPDDVTEVRRATQPESNDR